MALNTGRTYTGDMGAIMGRIQNLTQQVTSDIKAAPQIREQRGAEMMAQEGVLPQMAKERGGLIQLMFEADQQFAQKYSAPEAEYYIENPMARERMLQGYQAPIWSSIGEVNTLIGSRQKVLGDALDKGMAMYEAGIKAKQLELDSLFNMLSFYGQQAAAEEKKKALLDPAKYTGLMAMEGMFGEIVNNSEEVMLGAKQARLAKLALDKFGAEGLFGVGKEYLSKIKNYEDLRDGLASQIARSIAGERGVLNEYDIQRAKALIPALEDTYELRAQKLARLRSFIDTQWEGALGLDYAGETVKGMPAHLQSRFQSVYGTGLEELMPPETPDEYEIVSAR